MDCHEVRHHLAARGDDAGRQAQARKHLEQCQSCRAFAQRLHHITVAPLSPEQRAHSTISTERIMLAVEQRRRASRQLEDVRAQQKRRMERQRPFVIPVLALVVLAALIVPLMLMDMAVFQPDMAANMPPTLSDLVYVLLMLVQYMQAVSAIMAKNTLVLATVALLLVILAGWWLRLMQPPHRV